MWWRARPLPRPAPPPAPTLPLGRYLGRYADEQLGTLAIEQRGDSLVARMGDAWGVVSGIPDSATVLTVSLMGGRRRLEFTFSGGEPAVSVAMAGRTFRRTR